MTNKLFFLFEILNLCFALTALIVNSQSQSDFISIDCGASENYTDTTTGINYTSDLGYVETGVNQNVSLQFSTRNISLQFQTLRSFPEGTKNCYKLAPLTGKNRRYLIRASFLYGNFDLLDRTPAFDLYLGVNKWATVTPEDNTNTPTVKEIIHLLELDYIHVCLVKTGVSLPFISVLEMRLLGEQTYVSQSGSLELFARLNLGSKSGETVRFQDDRLDRIWTPFDSANWEAINTTSSVAEPNIYETPSLVMRTAVTSMTENGSIGFSLTFPETAEEIPEFYMYLHFSEIEKLESNQTREFNIYLNGHIWYGPLSPSFLNVTTIYSAGSIRGSKLLVMINRTENSTLPPLLNALEIYSVKNLPLSGTYQIDVDAIMNVKSRYAIVRDWQGDPCAPSDYKWEGLDCRYNASDPPRIISLNLSSSGLTGVIDTSISSLAMLEILDLSHNDLSGELPEFLVQMSSLKLLYLQGNNFSGTIPRALLEKSNNRTLDLRAEDNVHLCSKTVCKKNKSNKKIIIIIVVASIGGSLLLLLVAGSILWLLRRTKQSDRSVAAVDYESDDHQHGEELAQPKHQFSYSEILSMTNNFGSIIAKGGFGTVYEGNIGDGRVVAVKMLSRSSAHGYKQFNAEVKLLTRIRHKNLTAIVGYCDDGPNKGLVCEYMPNRDLAFHLSNKNDNPLTWVERLKVAIDAGQGLEYLHCDCKPAIIHRDVKSTNIVLNEKLDAKLSDFGLTRVFSLEADSHICTTDVGTPGYVDPQYYVTNRLTEKSDVYSFGIVLLELFTGRPAISKINRNGNIIDWVNFRYLKHDGDVSRIIDPRLDQDWNRDSVGRVLEIAMACVDQDSAKRPTMTEVVLDLKKILQSDQLARNNSNNEVIRSTELIENKGHNLAPGLFSR